MRKESPPKTATPGLRPPTETRAPTPDSPADAVRPPQAGDHRGSHQIYRDGCGVCEYGKLLPGIQKTLRPYCGGLPTEVHSVWLIQLFGRNGRGGRRGERLATADSASIQIRTMLSASLTHSSKPSKPAHAAILRFLQQWPFTAHGNHPDHTPRPTTRDSSTFKPNSKRSSRY